MYYSPSQLSPNSIEITANQNNTFTWQINTTSESQVKYNVFIRRVDNNTQIYTSGEITSSSAEHILPSGTLTPGFIYKWTVRSFYDSTNYTDSDWVIFYASETPTVTISATPTNQQTFQFAATYSHPQQIAAKIYRFKLYEGLTLVDDSGDLYPESLTYTSATPLTHTISGMLSGVTYSIECTVTTQQDKTISSGLLDFVVTYEYPDSIQDLTVTPDNSNGTIKLSWLNIKQVIPTTTGGYEYIDENNNVKYLHLFSNSTITYDSSVTIPENFTHIYYLKLPVGFSGEILNYDNSFKFGYNGSKFYYQQGTRITGGIDRSLPSGFFKVAIKSGKVQIFTGTYTETLI